MRRAFLALILAGALSLPTMSMAADAAKDEHNCHHSG